LFYVENRLRPVAYTRAPRLTVHRKIARQTGHYHQSQENSALLLLFSD